MPEWVISRIHARGTFRVRAEIPLRTLIITIRLQVGVKRNVNTIDARYKQNKTKQNKNLEVGLAYCKLVSRQHILY